MALTADNNYHSLVYMLCIYICEIFVSVVVMYRFKGTREGGISENASFFIFMQCSDGKTFEAYPIDEWYSFAPQVRYKYLDIDEAEDEYNKYNFLRMTFLESY